MSLDKLSPRLFHDTNRFATFSYFARLIAAEDITVRWNVFGMDSPAAMNLATRVLDIAPIKPEQEAMIPGLIIHEVGHFIYSPKLSTDKKGQRLFDQAKFEKLQKLAKNQHIYNVIEDGYIERMMANRWKGSLKYLRVRYDLLVEDAKKHGSSGSIILDIINTLNLNVIGAKWGDKHPYPAKIPKDLLDLLHTARITDGDEWARATLSGRIHKMLTAYYVPKEDSIRKLKEQVRKIIDEPAPAPMTIPKGAKVEETPLSSVLKEKEVADIKRLVEYNADAAVREEPKDNKVAIVHQTVDTATGEIVGEEEDKERDVTARDESDFEVWEQIEGVLEEFISDNTALLLGSNRYYMENVVERDTNSSERVIPTVEEIRVAANVVEIIDEPLRKIVDELSFARFSYLMQNVTEVGRDRETPKKVFNAFLKKIEKAKAIAQPLYQRFLTKANAFAIANTKKKLTGSLDMNRASMYMIYDDVFQRRRISPNQINHGYVVMVDWSSSMEDSAMELFHRILELTHFAKLAKVELEVWLYTTNDTAAHPRTISDPEVRAKLRNGVLLRGSQFIRVLNTNEHHSDRLLHRLFALFMNAMYCKKHSKSIDAATAECQFLWKQSYTNNVLHYMNGTNIFEALVFAHDIAAKMRVDKKTVMLMTDGADSSSFDTAVVANEIHRSNLSSGDIEGLRTKFAKVTMAGVDLLNFMEEAGRSALEHDKYGSNPINNIRTAASFLAAEEGRRMGIATVGITWGYYISKELMSITRGNVARVNIPHKELKSKNPTVYAEVTNEFILSVTKTLVADLEQ